jgi:DNA-binding response OmpR family regulator
MSGIVLVVDDDPLFARATALILTRHGWQTRLADNAASALLALDTGTITAVICDLDLPGDSGLTVIRSAVAYPSQPRVVAISGMLDANFFLLVAQRAGAHAALAKPFSEADLLGALTR